MNDKTFKTAQTEIISCAVKRGLQAIFPRSSEKFWGGNREKGVWRRLENPRDPEVGFSNFEGCATIAGG